MRVSNMPLDFNYTFHPITSPKKMPSETGAVVDRLLTWKKIKDLNKLEKKP